MSKTKFSRFEGTRGDKKQIFRTLVSYQHKYEINSLSIFFLFILSVNSKNKAVLDKKIEQTQID